MANSKKLIIMPTLLLVFSMLFSTLPFMSHATTAGFYGQLKWLQGGCKSLEQCKEQCIAAGYADDSTDLSAFKLMPHYLDTPLSTCGCPLAQKAQSPTSSNSNVRKLIEDEAPLSPADYLPEAVSGLDEEQSVLDYDEIDEVDP